MKFRDDRLDAALKTAHRARQTPEPGVLWQQRLMGHIQELGPREPPLPELMMRLTWRLAPLTAGLALLLGVLSFSAGSLPDQELAQLYFEDPVAYTVAELGDY